MDTLGEDLFLLAVHAYRGNTPPELKYALAGSELVRLAAARRIEIADGRIVLLGPDGRPAPTGPEAELVSTGDFRLDSALASIAGSKKAPKAAQWVQGARQNLVNDYTGRLQDLGVVQSDSRRVLGLIRTSSVRILDQERLDRVWAAFDAIARRTPLAADGEVPLDNAARAFAGLGYALKLGPRLYPGRDGREARKRLERIAKPSRREKAAQDEAVRASAAAAEGSAADGAARNGLEASTRAAITAALGAATQAATQAAVDAATDAAIHAAVEASVSAAHSAASHHGGAAAGGHGH